MSNTKNDSSTFQGLILALQDYWSSQGCILLQPLDQEVGAGTFHPATFLRAIGPEPWNAAYVQPSRRPTDGRFGENPNRLQHYYQFQVALKPSPDNIIDWFTFTGDMFFSAHTGLPFLAALLFWQNKIWRYVFLISSLIFGATVLLGHLHYSIDVFSAFFITYGIYHLAIKFFPKDYKLFKSTEK